jgi:hypothetical protein
MTKSAPFLRWLIGLMIALLIALSGFFVSWQWRQDDAIAGCMGPVERQSVQAQIKRLQDTVDRNQEINQKILVDILRRQINDK